MVKNCALSSLKVGEILPYDAIYKLAATAGTWHKKLRRVGAFIRILERWRTRARAAAAARRDEVPRPPMPDFHLNNLDWAYAEKAVLISVQCHHFYDEILQLSKENINTATTKKELRGIDSKIRALNPFIDHDGFLRVGSRLTKASIADETKFPVILPRGDATVRSIITYLHQKNLHAGAKFIHCEARQSIWILQGGQEIRSVIKKCVKCQRAFKRPLQQKMGVLPDFRVTSGHPFGAVGLDLAGPFGVRMNGRATHKIWAVIFACMRTRSVHVEIVHKLDAESLINAIARFSARRPGSTHFVSDNGTNMVAANRILKAELAAANETAVPALQRQGIKWEFIPARAPHRGGAWERIVALFKKHLSALALGDNVHVETFNTILVQIEGILNRRPLTAVSPDADDCEPLTPAHILYPSFASHQSCVITPEDPRRSTRDMRGAFLKAQSRVNAFWRSWSADYLTLLHNRTKWRNTKEDLKVGELVLLADPQQPRSSWKLARVTKADAEVDQHVRKAELRTSERKTLIRDRESLVRLELDCDINNDDDDGDDNE